MTNGKRTLRNGIEVPVIDHFDGEYAFLSNFYPAPVRMLERSILVDYPTAEHAYQACKTLDPDLRDWIRTAPTPGEAKRRGQTLELRTGWNGLRVREMRKVLTLKFVATEGMGDMLIATGDAQLIEGNTWHDVFWGDCRCDHHIGQGGLNHLGLLLMEIREGLQQTA